MNLEVSLSELALEHLQTSNSLLPSFEANGVFIPFLDLSLSSSQPESNSRIPPLVQTLSTPFSDDSIESTSKANESEDLKTEREPKVNLMNALVSKQRDVKEILGKKDRKLLLSNNKETSESSSSSISSLEILLKPTLYKVSYTEASPLARVITRHWTSLPSQYTSQKTILNTIASFDFDSPSPDDIVLQAQGRSLGDF